MAVVTEDLLTCEICGKQKPEAEMLTNDQCECCIDALTTAFLKLPRATKEGIIADAVAKGVEIE
jgi:hypothetical protein